MSVATDNEAPNAKDQPAGATRRYAPGADSVSFGVAKKLLSTSAWSQIGVVAGGLVTGAGLVAAHVYQDAIAATAGEPVRALVDVAQPTSLHAWTITALTLAIAGLCGVIFGLRRHRSDDLRGVYRWWMTATVACLVVSVTQATGLHTAIAGAVASAAGWTALAGDAVWWLLGGSLLLGPVAVRVVLDMKESRVALIASVVAAISGIVTLTAMLGGTPDAWAANATAITAGAASLTLLAALFAQLAYVRRIVQEAGGLIAPPAKLKIAKPDSDDNASTKSTGGKTKTKAKASKTTAKSAAVAAEEPAEEPAADRQSGRSRRKAKAAAAAEASAETQWVDGSGDYSDDYGDSDQPRRKLSKAERKRLRREKARQGRAA